MALEDFGNYTEVDPNSRITKTTRRATWVSLTRNEDAYVYIDKGAAFFSGDFDHRLTYRAISGTSSGTVVVGCWSLTNLIDDLRGIDTANGDHLALFCKVGLTQDAQSLTLEENDGGTLYSSSVYVISEDTDYFLKITRDETVGTYGTLYCYIYSDFARGTLLSTLSIALHTSKKDFRYLFAVHSFNTSEGSINQGGYVENLELFGASDPSVIPDVTTQPLTDIASTAATGNGTIVDLGISAVTAHGYCWATSIDPTTADSKTDEGAGSLGVFTSSITGLLAGQEYWARPYATNGAGTSYGANVYFIAGVVSSQLKPREIKIVQTRLHIADILGKERAQEFPLV